jgi:hypothetical protein
LPARPVYVTEAVHGEYPPASSRHRNEDASSALNVNVADVEFVGFSGLESIAVLGGVMSRVMELNAVADSFNSASRTIR